MYDEYKWLYNAVIMYGGAAIMASWFIKIVFDNIFGDWFKKDKE